MFKYIKGVIFSIGVLVLFFICTTIGFAFMFINSNVKLINLKDIAPNINTSGEYLNLLNLSGILAYVILFIIVLALVKVYSKSGIKNAIKIRKFEAKKVALIFVLAVGFYLLMGSIGNIAFYGFKMNTVGVINMNIHMAVTPLGIISIALISPIVEELLFRGVLFNYLRKSTTNTIFAIILSSLTCGLCYSNLQGLILGFILGVFLALIYMYTNSIWGNILCHSIFNILVIIESFILSNNSGYIFFKNHYESLIWSFIIIGIVLLGISYIVYRKINNNVENKNFNIAR